MGNGNGSKRLKRWNWESSNNTRTFRSQFELTRRFEGFRSRCRTFAECIYLRPVSTASIYREESAASRGGDADRIQNDRHTENDCAD